MPEEAMLARKLTWTGLFVLSYAAIAIVADFIVNMLILRHPAGFNPIESASLAVVIGVPSTFYLLSQRINLQRVVAERAQADAVLLRRTGELATSEERHRLLSETSDDVIIRYDTSGKVEYLSPAARRYGWNPDQLRHANVAQALDETEWARSKQFLKDLAAGRPAATEEGNTWKVRTPAGQLVYFEGRSSPVRSEDGGVIGAVAVLRDVSEDRRAREALRRNEERLRGLFELAPLGIALTDMDGHYVEFNDAFRRICGYAADELRTLDYWSLTPPRYAQAEAEQLASLAATGRYGPYEKEYVRKDGSSVPLRLNGMLVEGASGEKLIWSIVEEISEQRHTEAVLIQARNAAESAARAKSEFLSNMSHEIRTPLTGVVGFAGLLSAMDSLPETARRYADRIAVSAEALLSVVNDVLDFSKLEAGQVALDPHPFDPANLVETAVDLVRDRALSKGLALSFGFSGEPPPRLMADSARLRQVLLNLLTNAIKFTDQGSVSVTASYTHATGRLRLAVDDTGIGVLPEEAVRLFQRFSQVDSSSTRAQAGTGLGLAISKALIAVMGGEVGFESTAGKGSTFWLSVPAAVVEADDSEWGIAPAATRTADLAPLSLLLVDDVAVNRELVRTMLSPFEVALFEAASGAEAVAAALQQPFDLILMDLQMPGMDGMAATRAIRAHAELNRTTPILALSANVLPEQVAACLAAGMDDHLSKPINPSDFLDKIAWWTTARQPAEALAPQPAGPRHAV
jgi:PAS domain S-box-containing protein